MARNVVVVELLAESIELDNLAGSSLSVNAWFVSSPGELYSGNNLNNLYNS